LPDVPIRVIPILPDNLEHSVTVIPCRSKRVNLKVESGGKETYSFNGAMIGTVLTSESTIEIIVLIISSVLSTLVWLECHVGNDILSPELS